MISTKTKSTDKFTIKKDFTVRDDVCKAKLIKIPDWLKNTTW